MSPRTASTGNFLLRRRRDMILIYPVQWYGPSKGTFHIPYGEWSQLVRGSVGFDAGTPPRLNGIRLRGLRGARVVQIQMSQMSKLSGPYIQHQINYLLVRRYPHITVYYISACRVSAAVLQETSAGRHLISHKTSLSILHHVDHQTFCEAPPSA